MVTKITVSPLWKPFERKALVELINTAVNDRTKSMDEILALDNLLDVLRSEGATSDFLEDNRHNFQEFLVA